MLIWCQILIQAILIVKKKSVQKVQKSCSGPFSCYSCLCHMPWIWYLFQLCCTCFCTQTWPVTGAQCPALTVYCRLWPWTPPHDLSTTCCVVTVSDLARDRCPVSSTDRLLQTLALDSTPRPPHHMLCCNCFRPGPGWGSSVKHWPSTADSGPGLHPTTSPPHVVL